MITSNQTAIDNTNLLQRANDQQTNIKRVPVELYCLIAKNLDSESLMQFRLTHRVISNSIGLDLISEKLELERKIIQDLLVACCVDKKGKPTNYREQFKILSSYSKLDLISSLLEKLLNNNKICNYFCKKNAEFNYVYKSFLNKEGKLSVDLFMLHPQNNLTFMKRFIFDFINHLYSDSELIKKILNEKFVRDNNTTDTSSTSSYKLSGILNEDEI